MPTSLVVMIVSVVGVVMLAAVIMQYLETEKVKAQKAEAGTDEETAKKLIDLEDRVRTLERITTDPSERLKREIDDL